MSGDPTGLPLSFAQRRMWFFHQLEAESPLYNLSRTLRWRGPLDIDVLQRALSEVARRHDALRARFVPSGDSAVQFVAPPEPVALSVVDLTGHAADDREGECARGITAERVRPFDLVNGPLIRATVYQLDADEQVLLVCMHHIATDALSNRIILRELTELYAAYRAGAPSPLPEPALQYSDYACWQHSSQQAVRVATDLAWWTKHLAGAPPVLDVAGGRRPDPLHHRGSTVACDIPSSLADQLTKLGRQQRASLFMTLLAGFKALLWRYTGEADLVVGAPVAGRTRLEFESIVGCLTNTIVLRTQAAGDLSFAQLIERARVSILDAIDHQHLPFEQLVQAVHPERIPGRHPLFQVMVNYRDLPRPLATIPGVRLQDVRTPHEVAFVDLHLTFDRGPSGMTTALGYNVQLFERERVERMAQHYRALLEAAVADPHQRLAQIPLLSSGERHRLLVEWSGRPAALPAERCVHRLIEAQARRTPGAIGVVSGETGLTYEDVNRAANRVARELAGRGVGRGSYVPLLVDGGPDVVVGMLGVMKAGAAFVPLDPAWPDARISSALSELNCGVVLVAGEANRSRAEHLGAVPLAIGGPDEVGVDSDPDIPVGADDPIYAIYTSGSTGRPKAAAVPHRGIANRFQWMDHYFGLEAAAVVLQTTRYVYDSAVWQLLWPLTGGGRTVIPSGPELDAEAVSSLIARNGVTMTDFVPSVFNALVPGLTTDAAARERLQSLRALVLGGEEITPATTREFMRHFPAVRVVNLYGPTEASIGCICHALTGSEGEPIPIGRPISNVRSFVLDPDMNLVPAGVSGELYLGGACVGLGYVNNPENTAQAFVDGEPHGLGPGRLYRTGDRVRYLADGSLEFLGRMDRQVKLHGHRIELGEIEAVLALHPAVTESAVLLREDSPGEKRLVAYVVLEAGAATLAAELRAFVLTRVPSHMAPSFWVTMDRLPRLPGGKLDRRSLPVPAAGSSEPDPAYVAPRSLDEETLAAIWADLLHVERVGVHDNFFVLGGHSLLATVAMSRARAALAVDLPLVTLFRSPTVAGVAAEVERLRARTHVVAAERALPELEALTDEDAVRLLAAGPQEGAA